MSLSKTIQDPFNANFHENYSWGNSNKPAFKTAVQHADKLGDYDLKNSKLIKRVGLQWPLAAFLIVGDMAGSGIVALPTAIVQCQLWLGLVLLFAMATIGIVSAVLLGKCWVILLRRFPAYRTHCRKPYAEIGMKALGPKAKYLVMFCVNFTLFGVTIVFLLLSAKNIRDFLLAFLNYDLDFCLIILIVALVLLPITLPKSPKDFWPVIFIGMLCTGVAFCLIIIGSALDYSDCSAAREMPAFKMSNLLLALGTIRFTYGGHSGFPTISYHTLLDAGRDPLEETPTAYRTRLLS